MVVSGKSSSCVIARVCTGHTGFFLPPPFPSLPLPPLLPFLLPSLLPSLSSPLPLPPPRILKTHIRVQNMPGFVQFTGFPPPLPPLSAPSPLCSLPSLLPPLSAPSPLRSLPSPLPPLSAPSPLCSLPSPLPPPSAPSPLRSLPSLLPPPSVPSPCLRRKFENYDVIITSTATIGYTTQVQHQYRLNVL